MSEALQLPLRLWRNRHATRNMLTVCGCAMAVLLFLVVLHPETWSGLMATPLSSALWIGIMILVCILIVLFPLPAEIIIDRQSVSVKPVEVFGFLLRPAIKQNLDEFACVQYQKSYAGKGTYRLISLIGKPGHYNVVISNDVPEIEGQSQSTGDRESLMQDFTTRLGEALNMDVKINA